MNIPQKTKDRIKKQREARACNSEACEQSHCGECRGHTLGGIYCQECQIEDDFMNELAFDLLAAFG